MKKTYAPSLCQFAILLVGADEENFRPTICKFGNFFGAALGL
jgi:hypothetical protein